MFRTGSVSLKALTVFLFLVILLEAVPGPSGRLVALRPIPAATLTSSFSFSPSNPRVGQVVTFTGSASGGTSPYTFSWNFGDGGAASGAIVKHIFISLQTFTVTVTVTDSLGGTSSFQNSVFVGSLNPKVKCTPTIVRVSDITDNMTGSASFTNSPFSPGITTTVSGGVAKRWLTPGPTPAGWHSPGPSCIITNNHGLPISVYVEIHGLKRPSTSSEDPATSYDATNGGASYGGGTFNDFTFNAFDPALVPNYGTSCTSASDPTCYGRIHMEMDHDWQAAGYCGPGTTCDPSAFSSGTTEGVSLIDFQGFVYWDAASSTAQDHSFSGWELHPFTGWRLHQAPLTVSVSSSPSSPGTGQTVTFTGSASGGTGSYTFTWDFGDGTTGTGNPATHSYPTGSYNVHLSVTDSNGAVGVASKTVVVGGGTADFSVSSSPSSLTIQTGSSGNSTINLASLNSFSGTVSLSPSVSPSGLTASLSPTSVTLTSGGSGSSTLTVFSSTLGSYTVTVTGISGALSHTTTVTVNVVSTPDFSISSSPSSLSIQSPSSATSTIQLASISGFSGTLSLSAAAFPSGAAASLNPVSVALSSGGSASSTLTLSSSTPGNYTVTVTGTNGSISHSAKVTVTGVSSLLASDAAAGPSSLATSGGQKLIQDSAGKMIAVYVDSSGRIGLAYANSNPMLTGWSTTVKSPTPTSAYAWPAPVLVSLTSLRVLAGGGSGSGMITDIPVTIQRGASNNITGFTFGTPTTLDSSGLGRYPAAVLLQNGDILLAWAWQNTTRTMVKSLRWDPATDWTNIAGSSSLPDLVLVDASGIAWFIPNLFERPDNNNIYLLANRLSGPPSTIAYDKATWNGSGWSWGAQNLTYESNSSSGLEDPVAFTWDPVASTLVVSYGITGTQSFGVFTLSSSDVKTHLDTPSLAITERDWGTISVHITTGDYYIVLMNVNTDGGSGTLGYIRHPVGGSWNSTITMLDSATDNQGLNMRATGASPTLDFLYVDGTSTPAKVKFARLSPFNPPNFNISANPTSITVQSGPSDTSTVTLTSLYSFAGTVTLSTTVSPSGLAASLSTANVTLTSGGTAMSTLTVSSTKPGTYTVTVQGTSGSLSHTVTVAVTVTDVGPTVSFTESATTVPTSTAITLTISAADLDGTVSSLKVAWGDGTVDSLTGMATSDSHSYALAGSYTVYVNATDNANLTTKSSTATKTITDRPPTVSFTESATTAPTGTSISLTITAADPDGTVSNLKVVWGDGTIDSLAGSATSDSHAYSVAGSYHVYVNATDNSDSTAKSAVATKTITDRPPTVSFTESATTVSTGTSITLTITAADPDGAVSSLKVSWGDGTVDTLAESATSDSHAYPVAGTYQAYVNATDNSGSTTKSSVATKTITDRPPTVSFSESATTAPTGTAITLTITAADPDGTVSSLKVAWGDGTINNLAGSATGDSHSYSVAGTYQVYVNATDNSGSTTKSAVATKTIADRPPTVSFTESATTVPTGTSITLTITSSDPDGTVTSLKVVWGDGIVDDLAGTATSDNHSYSLAGSYSVYVNATDNAGLTTKSGAAAKTITDRPPAISFTESTATALTGTPITMTISASDPDGVAGSYAVYVNATDSANLTSKSASATNTIGDSPPTVSFTESATTVPTGTTITLTITAADPDGNVSALALSWGDGTIHSLAGSATSDSHAYSRAGAYQVYVNATDDAGLTTKSTVSTKTITDRPPVANFTESSPTALTGVAVSFNATSSIDPDGTVTLYSWSFGDGNLGTGGIISHAYSTAGTYTVTLTVTDDSDSTGVASSTVTIRDRPPVASFVLTPSPSLTLTSISFNATGSFDPDGTIVGYGWDFGDGSAPGSGVTVSHSYSKSGNYTVVLAVTDNNGLASVSSKVEAVLDTPPVPSFSYSPSSPLTGQTVSYDASSSSDPDGTVVAYAWNFGDGASASGATAQHSFAANGTFSVSLTVTDDSGSVATTSTTVRVGNDPAPVFPNGSSLSTINVGPRSLSLDWTPADDSVQVTSYEVYMNGTLLTTLAGSHTRYDVNGLNPLAHYVFRVQAENPSGNQSVNGPSALTFTDLPSDVNHDCIINIVDLTLVGGSFGSRTGDANYNANADLNGDGIINIADLAFVGGTFGQAC